MRQYHMLSLFRIPLAFALLPPRPVVSTFPGVHYTSRWSRTKKWFEINQGYMAVLVTEPSSTNESRIILASKVVHN